MARATLTSKGQVTIPKSVRERLGLSTGDHVDFEVVDSRKAILRPISRTAREVFGMLARADRKALSPREMDARVRSHLRSGRK